MILALLLCWFVPTFVCILIGYIINWKSLHTIKDFLFPLFDEDKWVIYCPIINFFIIAGIPAIALTEMLCDIKIPKFLNEFLNKKIK